MGTLETLLDSSEFWAAIAGALVGGGLTAIGGLFVYRRQAVREVRARIYEELIPKVPVGKSSPGNSSQPRPEVAHQIEKAIDPIERLAYLAGWRDTFWVKRLRKKLKPLIGYQKQRTRLNDYGEYEWDDDEAAGLFGEDLEAFTKTFTRFDRWLRRRL